MSKIICDLKKCSGCLACVVACIDQHYDETVDNAVSCRIYERFTAESGMTCYKTRSCLHCENAECMAACPTQALIRNEQGFVILQREKCIGCKACASACPYDVPRFDDEGKLVKCDGCAVRVAHGLEPACVRACNTGCLKLEMD